jgi:hypothetical protein
MSRLLSIFCVVSLITGCFFSCDVLEPDADVINPDVRIVEDRVFAYSDNATFIDLKSKIQTNQPVMFKVTVPTSSGALTDLGKGLLQYTPAKGNQSFTDAFEFTIFSERNQVIKKDTVFISVEKDSTDLPCGIFPVDDYVYVRKNVAINIPVLFNDYLCSADSADVVVSLVSGDESFPPYSGTAEVMGKVVVYTAGDQFEGHDKFIYKLHVEGQPENSFYGIVYLSGQTDCDFFRVQDDTFIIDPDSITSLLTLPVLDNDSLCLWRDRYTFQVAERPLFGQVTVLDHMLIYQLDPAVTVKPGFNEYFRYRICVDSICRTARVDITVRLAPDSCNFHAAPDSVDISANDNSLIHFNVLSNDALCNGYASFTITEAPSHGHAYASPELNAIAYQRKPTINKNDSLEYEICNAAKCSRAKVYIKRE